MTKSATIVGKAVRVAPGREHKPAAYFWKFWASGDEVYATTRSAGETTKISFHKSGQIHMRLGGKDLQALARPLSFTDGNWLHAVELRFLLSQDAFRPPDENLKGKRSFLIEVPDGATNRGQTTVSFLATSPWAERNKPWTDDEAVNQGRETVVCLRFTPPDLPPIYLQLVGRQGI